MTTNVVAGASRLVTRLLHPPITSDAEAFGTAARATERVVVSLGEPGLEQQRELRNFVLVAVESELARLGAAPAGWRSADPLDSILSDQLYRARLLGYSGLALRFSALDRLADGEGELGPEDSATLRQLFEIAEREPVQLYLPEPSALLRVLGAPRHLSDWLPAASKAGRVASIEYEPEPSSPVAEDVAGLVAADDGCSLAPPAVEAFSSSSARPAPAPAPSPESQDAPAPIVEATATEREHVVPPDPQQSQRCAAWAAQLQNMTGPKLHASVERAFLTAYVPLCREVAAGKAPAEARAAAEKWAEGFAQSYAAAFKQLNQRAKRPKMVKDVVEVGVRWLGQHRARQCQLLLVRGMRFDLGQRLNEEIERRLSGAAVCADQAVLWAALPSNSESQHIGQPEAARGARPKPKAASASAASAPGIDSVNIGGRELFKLDQLGDELSKAGEVEPARLQRLAAALAERVVPWMRQQPPETLVVVFGDHGFYWQATDLGTSAAHRGGALPEQVLVPASAWLLSEPRPKARAAAGLH